MSQLLSFFSQVRKSETPTLKHTTPIPLYRRAPPAGIRTYRRRMEDNLRSLVETLALCSSECRSRPLVCQICFQLSCLVWFGERAWLSHRATPSCRDIGGQVGS